MRISDWSSDVCSSDLVDAAEHVLHLEAGAGQVGNLVQRLLQALGLLQRFDAGLGLGGGERGADGAARELQPGQARTRDRKSTRLNSSHSCASRMPSSA